MSLSIKVGNFLYNNIYFLYKPLYSIFKNKQDAFEITVLKKNIKKGDVVLDIGANIGFYATLISELVGEKGTVHCFEPDQKNFKYLQQTCAGKKNIVLNNIAAGPKTEKIKIYTSKNLNVDHRTYKPDDYAQENEIAAQRMDDYFGENAHVDFIKIDIQGFEMQAMYGMQNIISANKNIKIVSEFWPYGLRKSGSSASAYYQQLLNLNLKCFLFDSNVLTELTAEKVLTLELLGEEHYFNIFATANHV